MKVCSRCGDEIATKDGDNLCAACDDITIGLTAIAAADRKHRNRQRRERDAMLRDLGLVKVRGALGGAYWE